MVAIGRDMPLLDDGEGNIVSPFGSLAQTMPQPCKGGQTADKDTRYLMDTYEDASIGTTEDPIAGLDLRTVGCGNLLHLLSHFAREVEILGSEGGRCFPLFLFHESFEHLFAKYVPLVLPFAAGDAVSSFAACSPHQRLSACHPSLPTIDRNPYIQAEGGGG